jgi:hypothetical protein
MTKLPPKAGAFLIPGHSGVETAADVAFGIGIGYNRNLHKLQ